MKYSLSLLLLVPALLVGAKFYDDDPLSVTPPPLPATLTEERELSDFYDLFLNTFTRPEKENGDTTGGLVPAQAVNTLGEVPDNEWYTNRIGTPGFDREALLRGPGNLHPPAEGPWTIISAKTQGITPGFLIEDSAGERYLLKFDPKTNPEMNSGADMLGPKLFYALGYNTPENYIVTVDPARLEIGEKATVLSIAGRERRMNRTDIGDILASVPRQSDGSLRSLASHFLSGQPIGPFEYRDTRSDDPNDIVPHEHRRDLRGLYVFASWLGHDDSRSINSLDMLVEENGTKFVKHHLIDFGSILGSASNMANSARSGNQYLYSWGDTWRQILSFGAYVPRWYRWHYADYPAIGRFEWEIYRPDEWTPEYPNPSFENRLPDDTYWAAKKVMAFSDDDIRAIVGLAEYSDPAAAEWLSTCLIKRRDKVGGVYLRRVLPADNFSVSEDQLNFEHLGAKYGLFDAPEVKVAWSQFDNATGSHTAIAGATGSQLPTAARAATDGFFAAKLTGDDQQKTVSVYLRKRGSSYQVVGIDRTFPLPTR
jgi:hypothetical protein